jgi:hypothetical protein
MPLQHVHSNSLPAVVFPLFLGIGDPESDDNERNAAGRSSAPHEDLPYRVELWDSAKRTVEVVLAVTANSSIGYAAYFAATREYPDRFVTLRHKNRTVAKINSPDN